MSSTVAACILLPILFSSSCTGRQSNRALVSGQENMASPTTKTVNLPKDSPMQLSVAFVLCNLNYEYTTNVQIIVSALTKVPHNQNAYADIAGAMLSRLIHRGDKDIRRRAFGHVCGRTAKRPK